MSANERCPLLRGLLFRDVRYFQISVSETSPLKEVFVIERCPLLIGFPLLKVSVIERCPLLRDVRY